MQLAAHESCEHCEYGECVACFDARHIVEHAEPDAECLSCRLQGTIQIHRNATPTKTKSKTPPRTPNNSWEKGIARDDRGMPLMRDGKPVSIKQYAENRHTIDAAVHRLENDPNVYAKPRS